MPASFVESQSSHDNFDIATSVKPVKLVEKFQHRRITRERVCQLRNDNTTLRNHRLNNYSVQAINNERRITRETYMAAVQVVVVSMEYHLYTY